MKLYLMQHGEALSPGEDSRRPLSARGRKETEKMASFLQSIGLELHSIWHSQKLRAVETAQILASYLDKEEVRERKDMNPLDSVADFPVELENFQKRCS